MTTSQTKRAADRYGYTGYGVAIVMPENVREEVRKVRGQLDVPVLTMPPHVTVKGTFADPASLDEIRELAKRIAADTRPFPVEFGGLKVWGTHDQRILVVSVTPSEELSCLHRRLMTAIGPISTSVYLRDRPEPIEGFHFHMTVYQGADEAAHAKGLGIAGSMRLPPRAEATGMHLFARLEDRTGHRWRALEEFAFPAAP